MLTRNLLIAALSISSSTIRRLKALNDVLVPYLIFFDKQVEIGETPIILTGSN